MLPKSNLHTHTTYSDGKNTPEEMVQAALERGFVLLGFSDHGYTPHDPAAMSLEDEARYRAEIRALQAKYAGQIEILLGYEHDFSMPDADLTPYDYVIESVHFLEHGGKYLSVDHTEEQLRWMIDNWYDGDPYRMARAYFDTVCRSIMTIDAQIVGHIGLITKFNEGNRMFDAEDPRYLNPAKEALRCAVERNMLVEINTGAMSRGYRSEPYPGATLLAALYDMGGQTIYSSDCHRAEWLDYAYEQAGPAANCCRA